MADIILFGASGGIGQHVIGELAADHRIHGTYHSADQQQLKPGATYHHVDVTDTETVQHFIEKIASGLEKPVLVYTPGISPNAVAHKCTDEDWDRALATNLTGAMKSVRAFLPIMRNLRWGRIILVSSVLARVGIPGTIAYSATKAALGAITRVVSMENATKGITANTLALGYFNVGIIKAVPEPYLRDNVIPGIPQHRLGDPSNITAAIRFIIDADYLTGATIDLNGGMIGA